MQGRKLTKCQKMSLARKIFYVTSPMLIFLSTRMLNVIHFALCNVLTFSLKMLRVNLFQFCINFFVKIFPVNILYLGKYWEFLNDFCFVLFSDMSSISPC